MVDCLDCSWDESRQCRDEVHVLNEHVWPKAKPEARHEALPWREGLLLGSAARPTYVLGVPAWWYRGVPGQGTPRQYLLASGSSVLSDQLWHRLDSVSTHP